MSNQLYSTNAQKCEEELFRYSQEFLKVKFIDTVYLSYEVLRGIVSDTLDQYNMQHYDAPLDAQFFNKDNVIRRIHEQKSKEIYQKIMQNIMIKE